MKYKVGDKVRIRSWEDMAAEFGINEYGYIENDFVASMRYLCGSEVTIVEIFCNHYIVDHEEWAIYDSMLEDIT